LFMLIEAFGIELPSYLPIVITLLLVGVAFWMSKRLLTKQPNNPQLAVGQSAKKE
jgi:hypothetical protein